MTKFTITATQPARYSITLEANTVAEAIEIAKETNASEWEFEGYEDWEQYQVSSVQYRLESLKQE
tara:strand:+ start:1811 stop:2005 length:195 start_codon:yes stop_codon:yes gene_type:complete